jgi:formylmethanofuran dehydrogenase subunit E
VTAEKIMNSEDFKKCERFHGHVCPGLAIGYHASKAALSWLEENRSADEEIVAIVENDACCVDAIQVLTGCTFGKGNFIFKDHGKMVFTFFSRNTGNGVRISMKPGVLHPDERHPMLREKVVEGTATDKEREEFEKLHLQRTKDILNQSFKDLFVIENTNARMPSTARIELSEICPLCGEPVMPSKMEFAGGQKICRSCRDIQI